MCEEQREMTLDEYIGKLPENHRARKEYEELKRPTFQITYPGHQTKPHRCPVCCGSGIVSRPPWMSGDVETWASSGTNTYTCNVCCGKGVLWS